MTGRSPSSSPPQPRKQARLHLAPRAPSAQAVIIASVALLILFLWMHFILAMEIETIGRQIQEGTEELRRISRENDALRREIAEAGSNSNLARRAEVLGFERQPATYLILQEPLARPTVAATPEDTLLPTDASVGTQPGFLSDLAQTFDGLSLADGVP
jgi:hypothetical protein